MPVEDYTLDHGLNEIDANATHIYICSQVPTTHGEATTGGTYALGNKNFGTGAVVNGTMADATPSGRKITTNAVTDGSVTNAGTVTAWAITDNNNSRLLATGDVTSFAVTSGQFTLNAIVVTIPAEAA